MEPVLTFNAIKPYAGFSTEYLQAEVAAGRGTEKMVDEITRRSKALPPRFYVQWATVCWQVRDGATHGAVAFHKHKADATSDANRRNAEVRA